VVSTLISIDFYTHIERNGRNDESSINETKHIVRGILKLITITTRGRMREKGHKSSFIESPILFLALNKEMSCYERTWRIATTTTTKKNHLRDKHKYVGGVN